MESSAINATKSAAELRQLVRRTESAFAILDACDEPRVVAKAWELGSKRAACLYRGAAEHDYSHIAPYLFLVDEPLLDWIVDNLWGDPWGVIAIGAGDLDALRQHFRRFLMVKLPDGREVFFRFYDPRVLAEFLASCSEQELAEFFGPVRQFWIAQGEAGMFQVAQREEGA